MYANSTPPCGCGNPAAYSIRLRFPENRCIRAAFPDSTRRYAHVRYRSACPRPECPPFRHLSARHFPFRCRHPQILPLPMPPPYFPPHMRRPPAQPPSARQAERQKEPPGLFCVFSIRCPFGRYLRVPRVSAVHFSAFSLLYTGAFRTETAAAGAVRRGIASVMPRR